MPFRLKTVIDKVPITLNDAVSSAWLSHVSWPAGGQVALLIVGVDFLFLVLCCDVKRRGLEVPTPASFHSRAQVKSPQQPVRGS